MGLWWAPFVQSRKKMSLKFTGELCVMTMESDVNLNRNWLLSSKVTWSIWQILTQALENLKSFHFNWLFLTKVYNVWAKKAKRSYVWWNWRLIQGKLTCSSRNDIRNLANFDRLKNSDFILRSKMAELNQNQNSIRPEWPDALWKHYFNLEINE